MRHSATIWLHLFHVFRLIDTGQRNETHSAKEALHLFHVFCLIDNGQRNETHSATVWVNLLSVFRLIDTGQRDETHSATVCYIYSMCFVSLKLINKMKHTQPHFYLRLILSYFTLKEN